MAKIDKARFWTGVLYPENMREDWKEVIGDTLQYPYAYCQHSQDKDSKSEHRKDHVHLIVAFPNTTTYKHALNVMDLLSAEGKKAINKCEAVVGAGHVALYLGGGRIVHASTARTGIKYGYANYKPILTIRRIVG